MKVHNFVLLSVTVITTVGHNVFVSAAPPSPRGGSQRRPIMAHQHEGSGVHPEGQIASDHGEIPHQKGHSWPKCLQKTCQKHVAEHKAEDEQQHAKAWARMQDQNHIFRFHRKSNEVVQARHPDNQNRYNQGIGRPQDQLTHPPNAGHVPLGKGPLNDDARRKMQERRDAEARALQRLNKGKSPQM